jgi:hypothetical protein
LVAVKVPQPPLLKRNTLFSHRLSSHGTLL